MKVERIDNRYKYWDQVMGEKSRESDMEIHFKDTFRAFSKDNDGNSISLKLTAKEKKWFLHVEIKGCI